MKNKLFAATGLFLVILAFYACWKIAFVLPKEIESYTKSAFSAVTGMGEFQYARKDVGLSHMSFYQIKLDKDGFSRVEQINVLYSPFALFIAGAIESIQILAPDISISVQETALHNALQRLLSIEAPDWVYAINTLVIEGGRINLLTEDMGTLRIDWGGIVRTTDDGKSGQFQIEAAQKQLSGALKISGVISPDHNWHIDGVLEDGRIDHDLLQLSRITGQITLDSAGKDGYYAKSEVSIGGARIPSGHAFSDIAASYELDQNSYNFLAGGKALGFENIELGFAYNSKKPDTYTGTIYTPSLPEFIRYYTNERGAYADTDPNKILQNIFFSYALPKDQLWSADKTVLLKFDRMNIADFTPVYDGAFYGNGLLRGAIKIGLSSDDVTVGGLALESHKGNFVFEQPLLRGLSQKLPNNAKSAAFLKQAVDFHYESLGIAVTGTDGQSDKRQVSINIKGAQNIADHENYTFTYNDDLLWFWNALLGTAPD